MNEILSAALRYIDDGTPVIPVDPDVMKDKSALVKWKPYQTRLPEPRQVEEWWTRWPDAMIGGITGAFAQRTVIDTDPPDGEDHLEPYLPENCETPTIGTPRDGKHRVFQYFKPAPNTSNLCGLVHVDCRNDGGYHVLPPSRNSAGGAYKWLIPPDACDVLPMPQQLCLLINKINNKDAGYRGPEPEALQTLQGITNITLGFTEGSRDNDLFHVAMSLLKGGMTPDNALICLKILAAGCKPPFPEKEVMAKFESALQRVLSKERNISAEVREWVNITFSYFSITDLLRDITIITSEEKNRARVAIHRLCEEGVLERAPGKHGVYRRIEKECDDIDFLHVNTDTENIILPFNLHEWVEILPGNVIIVAGEPDAGKTAFLLNVVRQNMFKYDVWYFSSEMFGKEFNTRLSKYEGIRLDEWKFHAKSRASNFADVVRPGRGTINIIDFLEVYKDFYEVGRMIADIHAKLDGAIAIIALQKNQGAEVGVGGFRSLEKARLYLNMSRDNKIQIYKAKNWKDSSRNPNKRVLEYRIHGGCNLEARTDWVRP